MRRALASLAARDIGQPWRHSHPHLFRTATEAWPGIESAEFAARRRALSAALGPGTAALVAAHCPQRAARNVFHPYRQGASLLYLCGVDTPGAALLVRGGSGEATLYLEPGDAATELWDGPATRPEDAIAAFGMEIRLVKSGAEVDLMRRACAAGAAAMADAMRFSLHGAHSEADVAARFEYAARLRGSAPGGAYVPVAAAGAHATVIHYMRNDAPIATGQKAPLFLLDAGARLHGYCSDVTRTWPLAGRFSAAQRRLYDAVRSVQRASIARLDRAMARKEALSLRALHYEAAGLMEEALCRLGFPASTASSVFPHSIGHHLGMDVHDGQGADVADAPLVPGNIVTVEPGAYVRPHGDHPEEYVGMGIRIEDDVLLTPSGAEILTDVPREADDVEALLATPHAP